MDLDFEGINNKTQKKARKRASKRLRQMGLGLCLPARRGLGSAPHRGAAFWSLQVAGDPLGGRVGSQDWKDVVVLSWGEQSERGVGGEGGQRGMGEREREREREQASEGEEEDQEREVNHVISCEPSPHKSVDSAFTELIFSILLPSPLIFANDIPCTGTASPLLLRPPRLSIKLEEEVDRGGPLRSAWVGRCMGRCQICRYASIRLGDSDARILACHCAGPRTNNIQLRGKHGHQEQGKNKLEDGEHRWLC
jgi:hypothetical protein